MALVLGLVGALVMGILLVWLRFKGAGLPAGDGLRATSLAGLLLIGFAELLLYAAAGVVAVALARLIDRKGTAFGQSLAATVLAGVGIGVAIVYLDGRAGTHWATAIVLVVVALVVGCVVALTTTNTRIQRGLSRHPLWAAAAIATTAAAVAARLALEREYLPATATLIAGVLLAGLVALAVGPWEKWPWPLSKLLGFAGAIVRGAGGVVGLLLLAVLLRLVLGSWAVPALTVLAGALVAALLWALKRAPSFRWYAVSVFAVVLAFGVALSAMNAWREPKLRPVAVLDADGTSVAGFFVAEGPQAVHVGTVRNCQRSDVDLLLKPTERAVPGTGQITRYGGDGVRYSVGQPTNFRNINSRAQEMLRNLRLQAGLPDVRGRPCAGQGVQDLKVRQHSELDPDRARQVASRFRPMLMFDSLEYWRPLQIEELMAERGADGAPAHKLCRGKRCVAAPRAKSIRGPSASNIDFSGFRSEGGDASSPTLADCPKPQDSRLRDCDGGARAVMYYRVTAANHRRYVDYWWYLRYNNFGRFRAAELCRNRWLPVRQCFDHEGDWEGVTVITSARDHDQAAYIGLAQHDGVHRRRARDLPRLGQRPMVYVARGSHASYSKDCPTECAQLKSIRGWPLPETNTDGKAKWARNDDARCSPTAPCLLPLATQPWKAYAGRWGSQSCRAVRRYCALTQGPKSPARQQRYQAPWCHSVKNKKRLQCDEAARD